MLITYLGHAGFCVETSRSLVIMDPWLSPLGAFDSAWFQFHQIITSPHWSKRNSRTLPAQVYLYQSRTQGPF